MPVDIRFSLPSGDTTVTVWNDRAVQHYAFTFLEDVTGIAFDPESWILATSTGRPLATVPSLNVSPNPFTSSTSITFETRTPGRADVVIYDVTGARVRTVQRGDLPAAFHQFGWDGRNDLGNTVAQGVYFVRLELPQGTFTRKAVLTR